MDWWDPASIAVSIPNLTSLSDFKSTDGLMGLCLHCVDPKTYFSLRFWIDLWTRFVFQSELTADGTTALLCQYEIWKYIHLKSRLMIFGQKSGRWAFNRPVRHSEVWLWKTTVAFKIRYCLLLFLMLDFNYGKKSLIKLKTWKLIGLKSPQVENWSVSSSVSILDQTSPAATMFRF